MSHALTPQQEAELAFWRTLIMRDVYRAIREKDLAEKTRYLPGLLE